MFQRGLGLREGHQGSLEAGLVLFIDKYKQYIISIIKFLAKI